MHGRVIIQSIYTAVNFFKFLAFKLPLSTFLTLILPFAQL